MTDRKEAMHEVEQASEDNKDAVTLMNKHKTFLVIVDNNKKGNRREFIYSSTVWCLLVYMQQHN